MTSMTSTSSTSDIGANLDENKNDEDFVRPKSGSVGGKVDLSSLAPTSTSTLTSTTREFTPFVPQATTVLDWRGVNAEEPFNDKSSLPGWCVPPSPDPLSSLPPMTPPPPLPSEGGDSYQSYNWRAADNNYLYQGRHQQQYYHEYGAGAGGYWGQGNFLVPPNHYNMGYYGGAGSVLSRESSRDDLTSMADGQIFEYEDRFRVDRRKLELLIMGRFDPVREPAGDFFVRIGEETGATVIWPTRLKIGAKSKKDPHIRVGGCEDSVRRAKARIMEYLDTRSNRVTMKMDVSYTDHSHVIGKGGNTIRRVMAETNCHIHFPDSNRNNPLEKSNQVSIAGEIDGVETARARVRELTPLIFCFDLPVIPSIQSVPDQNDPYLKAIQDQYNIQVTFRQKQKNFHTTVVVIKGSECEASRVKESTLLLIEHLCRMGGANVASTGGASGNTAQDAIVTMNMEISPQHHPIVLGKGNITLKWIMQKTNTTILFPDASDPNIPSIRKGSVTITGSIHNVYLARQQLIGSLPLVMMFDIPDDPPHLTESLIQQLQNDLDVSISIKPKARQSTKSVVIKAQERNAGNMYKSRVLLLGLEDPPTKATIPETYNIHASSSPSSLTLPVNHRAFSGHNTPGGHNMPGHNFGPSTNNNNQPYFPGGFVNHAKHNLPPLQIPGPNSPLPPLTPSPGTPHPQHIAHIIAAAAAAAAAAMPNSSAPAMTPTNTPALVTTPNTPWAQSNVCNSALPPNHPYLMNYAMLVLNNITRLQQQQNQDHQGLNVPQQDRADGSIHSPPIPGKSPRNSSPVRDDGNLSNNLSKMDLNHSSSGLGTDSMKSSSATSAANSSMYNNNKGSSPTVFGSNNNNKSSPSGGGGFGTFFGDRRAPGCEKEINSLFRRAQGDLSEYDHKKLLATKAMTQKPSAGQPRTPNPTWSGMGFSSSMPESMIKERLEETADSRKMSNEESIMEEDEKIGGEYSVTSPHSPHVASTRGNPGSKMGPTSFFGNSSAFDALLNHTRTSAPSSTLVVTPDDDLPSVLVRDGLAKYADTFVRQEIDLRTFATLTEEDLKEIGVQTFGARKKMLLLANKVKQSLQRHNW